MIQLALNFKILNTIKKTSFLQISKKKSNLFERKLSHILTQSIIKKQKF